MSGCLCGGSCGGCGSGPLAACGCCEGLHVVTPVSIYNQPGLTRLAYRVGTHGRFLATMLARLSSRDHAALEVLRTRDRHDASVALLDGWATVADVLTFYQERIANEGFLRTATERRSVLELARLIGYTPRPGLSATALVAYTVETGAALTIPPGSKVQSVPGPKELPQTFETFEPLFARGEFSALSPRRARPQSVTGPTLNELTKVVVAGVLSDIKPGDMVRAQVGAAPVSMFEVTKATPDPVQGRTTLDVALRHVVVPAPASSTAAPGGPLERLKTALPAAEASGVSEAAAKPAMDLVKKIGTGKPDDDDDIVDQLRDLYSNSSTAGDTPLSAWLETVVEMAADAVAASQASGGVLVQVASASENGATRLGQLVAILRKPGSVPPPSQRDLRRNRAALFATQSGAVSQLFGVLVPEVKELLGPGLANIAEPDQTPASFDRMAVKAALFGHQATPLPKYQEGVVKGYVDPTFTHLTVDNNGGAAVPSQFLPPAYVRQDKLLLDREYDGIQAGQSVVLFNAGLTTPVAPRVVKSVEAVSVGALGLTGRVTQLTLDKAWPDKAQDAGNPSLSVVVRRTQVFAQPHTLRLAHELMDDEDVEGDVLELDGLHLDLTPGRFVIVTGERTDADLQEVQDPTKLSKSSTGVPGAEPAMISSVEHRVSRLPDGTNRPRDTVHTFLRLAPRLEFSYRRPTVVIRGNVVKATHGATVGEVMGAGNGTQRFQRFPLKQPPLTYLPAPTAVGAESTLEVRVNDVRWHETVDFLGAGPNDRRYVIRTEDDGQTSVVFGDGERGSRLPTGLENVRARYRSGLGTSGNVGANRVTIAVDRPFGVKEVVNPLPATGGADQESRDQARRNAPIGVQALDRLVSVQDYADFARGFAGIGAASAAELSDGRRELVHVTIAGVGDAPIAPSSDLFRNLRQALVDHGDPFEPLEIAIRTLRALVIEAGVRLDPNYLWASVEPALRSALLNALSAERRLLGQDVVLAEVLATMQAVAGVVYVQLRVLDALDEASLSLPNPAAGLALRTRVRARLAERQKGPAGTVQGIAPAQLAILTPTVPETLILSELR